MKNLIKYILILTSLSALSACSFLEVDNTGKSDTGTFFTEMDGLRTAMVGVYSTTYSFYDTQLYKYSEVAGDMVQASAVGGGSDMYYQYNFLSTPDLETTSVGYIWKNGYNVLVNVNTILNYTPSLKSKFPKSVAEIEQIEAQSYFIRALIHFDLVRCYAQPYGYVAGATHLGIPIVTKLIGVGDDIARASVADVYKQILADLHSASSILGDAKPKDAHYISGVACTALQARVNLYMKNYVEAERLASDVIGKLSLTPHSEYIGMFTEQQLGDEAIFRLSGYYAGGSLERFYDTESPIYTPSKKLTDLFVAEDVRLQLVQTPEGKNICYKYEDLTGSSSDDSYYNITVLRLSELYLIRAEARCLTDDLTGAADDIKALESRALDVSNINLSYIDAGDLMNIIKDQRVKELSFEGHRFFDLARWGDDIVRDPSTNASTKRLDYPDYRFALPISTVEMDANKAIIQNDGY